MQLHFEMKLKWSRRSEMYISPNFESQKLNRRERSIKKARGGGPDGSFSQLQATLLISRKSELQG